MTLLLLCLEFMKAGVLAIGGGLSIIPFLIQMSENHPDWFSLDTLTDMIAISESTPGPIGINMATFTGYNVAGVPGAVLASIAMILPCFFITIFVSRMLQKYQDNHIVQNVFVVLRAVAVGLIASATYTIIQAALFHVELENATLAQMLDWRYVLVFAVMVVAMLLPKLKKLHVAWFILIGAVIGIAFKF